MCAKSKRRKGSIKIMSGLAYNLRKNIRREIQKHNMTDQEFADALKYTADDMERLFSGELLLPPREIERIARLFKTTKNSLLGL